MGAIVRAIGWLLGKVLGDKLLSFVAMKAISVTLVCVVLPIVLNNLIYDLMEIMVNIVKTQLGQSGLAASVISVTGTVGWLFNTCNIGQSLAVILAAIIVRASLNMVPFVRI